MAFRAGSKAKATRHDAIGGIKPELLHIRVTRALERIGARSPQLRAKLLKQLGVGQQIVLHALRQGFKLALKLFVQQNLPWHIVSMY